MGALTLMLAHSPHAHGQTHTHEDRDATGAGASSGGEVPSEEASSRGCEHNEEDSADDANHTFLDRYLGRGLGADL